MFDSSIRPWQHLKLARVNRFSRANSAAAQRCSAGDVLDGLVTTEVLVVFAVSTIATTDFTVVGNELNPFDPFH